MLASPPGSPALAPAQVFSCVMVSNYLTITTFSSDSFTHTTFSIVGLEGPGEVTFARLSSQVLLVAGKGMPQKLWQVCN